MKVFMKIWLIIGLTALGLGIVVTVIASSVIARGASFDTFSYKESYEDVRSLNFSINFGKVIIREGDEFSIDASNLLDEDFRSYVEDGTWIIEEDTRKNIIGIDFSFENVFLWNHGKSTTIIITLPKDFIAEELYINVCAGYVRIHQLQADNAELKIDTGRLNAEYITINNSAEFAVDIGELRIENLTANNVKADCSFGNIHLGGSITGDNSLNCDVGAISLDLEGKEKDYRFNVYKDIANIEINGIRYNDRYGRNNSDQISADFDIKCDIGSISIDTN